MRRLIVFPCKEDNLVGSLDDAPGSTGLLIVSGGNEIRAGAHRGMALLAAGLAVTGTPAFRYDRRGVGDSGGINAGFEGARDDLIAAVAAFRAAAPHVTRLIGFGNCDAATTLAWWGREVGIDAVALANPWTVAPTDDLPPPAAIRAHYAHRLRDPRAWAKLLGGGVSLSRLFNSLKRSAPSTSEQELTRRTLASIAGWGADATVILATGDPTAIAYADAARRAGLAPRTIAIDTASHSFARPADAAALAGALRSIISERG